MLTKAQIEKIAKEIARELRPFNARWMKLRFAATYVGINKKKLKQLAEDGEIVGYPDPDNQRGDWVFDRNSLDEYRINQRKEFELKVVELSRGI
jgi:hypothetical protein